MTVMNNAFICLAALLLSTGATAVAQAPDFNGWFRLNKATSQVTAGVGLAGLGQGGAPHTLFITQAANGTISVGSDINESQSRLYRVNGDSALPAGQGHGDLIRIKSRRDGGAIVAEGAGLKETLALSADGQTLTISVAARPGTTTLVYNRMQRAEPCTAWPTPCRRK
jgi:hypothetical protein